MGESKGGREGGTAQTGRRGSLGVERLGDIHEQ